MILNIIATTVLATIAAAIIYFVFIELMKIKKFKNDFFIYKDKPKNNDIIAKENNVFDSFVNNEMSFEEIKQHALNIEKIKRELSSDSNNQVIEVDYVTASQILKNWDKKVLISEDGKLVLTNIKNKNDDRIVNEKKSEVIIEENNTKIKKEKDTNIVIINEKKSEVIIKENNHPLDKSIDSVFETILDDKKIKFEENFYDYIFEENFSSMKLIHESIKKLIEKEFYEIVKKEDDIYVKAEVFFKFLLELNENEDFNIIDENFIEKYLSDYSHKLNNSVKANFIYSINKISPNLFYINEKDRFTKYSFFVLDEKEKNERIIKGNFIVFKNIDSIQYKIKEPDIAIPNVGGANLYITQKREAINKEDNKDEPIF